MPSVIHANQWLRNALAIGLAQLTGCGLLPSDVQVEDIAGTYSAQVEFVDSTGTASLVGELTLTLRNESGILIRGSYAFTGAVVDGPESVQKFGRGGLIGSWDAGSASNFRLSLDLGTRSGDVQLMSLEGAYDSGSKRLHFADGTVWVFYPPCDLRCSRVFEVSTPLVLDHD